MRATNDGRDLCEWAAWMALLTQIAAYMQSQRLPGSAGCLCACSAVCIPLCCSGCCMHDWRAFSLRKLAARGWRLRHRRGGALRTSKGHSCRRNFRSGEWLDLLFDASLVCNLFAEDAKPNALELDPSGKYWAKQLLEIGNGFFLHF